MAVFVITYDLSKPGRNYDELYRRIEAYEGCAWIAGSTWLINTDDSAKAIREYLMAAMDKNDTIFVGKMADEGASMQCGDPGRSWIGWERTISRPALPPLHADTFPNPRCPARREHQGPDESWITYFRHALAALVDNSEC